MTVLLDLEKASKRYGDQVLLDEASAGRLRRPHGEWMSIAVSSPPNYGTRLYRVEVR